MPARTNSTDAKARRGYRRKRTPPNRQLTVATSNKIDAVQFVMYVSED